MKKTLLITNLFTGILLLGQTNIFPSNGKVGIGTTAPVSKLHVAGEDRVNIRVGGPSTSAVAVGDFVISTSDGLNISNSKQWAWSFRTDEWSADKGDMVLYSYNGIDYTSPIIAQSDGDLLLATGKGAIRNGNVGIGTINPSEKLTVKGMVYATEVKVDNNVPADYVFEKYYEGNSILKEKYTMPTLEEVEEFTKKNKHLSEIPSAKEIQEKGMSLGQMTNLLLQKIEELTLYTIEQNKVNKAQQEKITELETKINVLNKKVAD